MQDYSDWTENDIQSLKAQEAKDFAAELLAALLDKEKGPISPGEVQLQELEFELRLKKAEQADAEAAREHERRLRALELELEKEKTRQAEAKVEADRVRSQFADLVQQVRDSEESLGVQLERATRQHRLRLEQLESEYETRSEELRQTRETLQAQCEQLKVEIAQLAEIRELAENLAEVRASLESERKEFEHQQSNIDQELAELEHQKTKKVTEIKRSQELELARLETEFEKQKIQGQRSAAEAILSNLGLRSISEDEFAALRSEAQSAAQQAAADVERIRTEARREVLAEFNITTKETLDVTRLYYDQQSLTKENESLRAQLNKLEAELQRARQHIEAEPERVARTVEAARTQVQNIVEPAGK